MTHERWTTGDTELTGALRALYAAPAGDAYWDALEARILAHVARGDDALGWYGELADMVRPGLIAAAGLILAASLAMLHSRQAETRDAYASVIGPAGVVAGPVSRATSVGDGDAAIQFILSR